MLYSLKVPLSNKYTTGNNVIQILIFQMSGEISKLEDATKLHTII